jgi:hypothetical protein
MSFFFLAAGRGSYPVIATSFHLMGLPLRIFFTITSRVVFSLSPCTPFVHYISDVIFFCLFKSWCLLYIFFIQLFPSCLWEIIRSAVSCNSTSFHSFWKRSYTPRPPIFQWSRFVILIMILHAARHASIHFFLILFLALRSWDKSLSPHFATALNFILFYSTKLSWGKSKVFPCA